MSSAELYARDFTAFDSKTGEQQLREIADREEIRALVSRYALGIARNFPVYELFTEDAVFIDRIPGRPIREFTSLAPLLAMYQGVPAATPPLPMIHNHIIEIDGDEAIGVCSIEIRWIENGESVISSGYYDDKYRRVNGRWMFAERDVKFFHWCTLKEGWAQGNG
jgi:hypothetical protein